MPSSEKHSRKDKGKHDKDKWHVKTLDEIREEKKKKKKENEEKKKSKDPGKEMEKAPRQRHTSSGDEKMDDDEDDVLNIQPPQAKPSTQKDSRNRKEEKRKHGRSHSRDKDRKRRKRSRSAEKGKSRSKDADRVRDRDRERERERPRERERDDYNRDREKKSRSKEHREETRPAPSSVHHDDSRQAGSSGQGHQSDLRQMIIDKRDDTRQVTVVAERVQQKETERRPREGKKEGEREKERREDRHEDRHREREKREKDEKREKSRESSKQEGTKDRSRSRKDEIIEERREGSRPSSKERSTGSNRSEERGDSRSRRPDKEPQSSSNKDRSPHRSSREDKRKRDDRRKEGRESEQDPDQRRKSKSTKSNERERWQEDDGEHHQREEHKMEKEEEQEEEYERRDEEEEHEVENASSSEEEEEESDDEEEEDEEEESSEAESESEEEEEEVEIQEASSSEEEESAEEGEASVDELEEGEHKQSDEEEEEEEEGEEEEEEEEESEEEESDSDSDSESEDESEKSGSEAYQDETLKEEEKAKVKQEKEVDSSKIYVPKSKFDDDSPSPSSELQGLVEKEVEEEEVMDQSDTEYLQDSPVASPVELEEKLPPYLPAIQGCRSVEEFQCLNRIAEGTYGVVYRANEKKKNDIVALKRLKMEKEKEGFPITSLREISTLLKAQHRNIVTVREIVVGSNMDKIYIVMDYVEHDLKSLMETMKQPFTIGETKCLMLQLLRGVHHLHDNWILHRDLKTSNLLLNHQGCLKIGDFGLAREYGSPIKPYTSIVVTLWYRAPELLLGTKVYSTPIDMWSVGCIFAEFLTIKPIFNGRSEIDQLNRIFKELGTPSEKIWPGYNELPAVKKTTFAHHPYNNLRSRFGTYLTDIGFELLNRFLTYDPVRRVSAEDALKHTYFTESPQPINEDMFPTWPAKSEMVRTNKPRSPQAPEGGQQFAKLEKEDGDSGFRMALPTQGSSAASAGFSLKF